MPQQRLPPAVARRRPRGISRMAQVSSRWARKIPSAAILAMRLMIIVSQKRYASAAGDDAIEGMICTTWNLYSLRESSVKQIYVPLTAVINSSFGRKVEIFGFDMVHSVVSTAV